MLLSPNPLGEVIIPQIHPLSCIVAIIPITTSQGQVRYKSQMRHLAIVNATFSALIMAFTFYI